jgi:LysW-gamma-L-lysine carboxypeptidase
MNEPLYVIKLGSGTILDPLSPVFAEIRAIVDTGVPVLVVAGGGEAIRRKYEALSRPIPYLTLKGGDKFRYCSPAEMPIIVAAYDEIIAPALQARLQAEGLRPYVAIAGRNALVTGTRTKPLRTVQDGREVLVRDSRVGSFAAADLASLRRLLETRRVVCLMPPIAETATGELLNVDADLLASGLSTALGAHHLRFVTGTAGLLTDLADPSSTIPDIYPGDEIPSVQGRMKQKLRAAREAGEQGVADVAICGPARLGGPSTRFWPAREPRAELRLITQVASLASVSGDEAELARYLVAQARAAGLESEVDAAGNFVARKGSGPVTLMMMGHLDTVPHLWKAHWAGEGDAAALSARGAVDAKGCVANFLESAIAVDVPDWAQLVVIGATEEEVSSSRGAFYARDHYRADAVVIGEPSGAGALTLGYFGLFKLQIRVKSSAGHSAGKEVISASDCLIRTVEQLRARVGTLDPGGINSLIEVGSSHDAQFSYAEGILNFRASPAAPLEAMLGKLEELRSDTVSIEVLRATPGVQTARSTGLAKAFGRAFAGLGLAPRYLVKKGSSDMNTLATTWRNVPMVAYGPGDSSLDHTDHESLPAGEYLQSRRVLDQAVREFFAMNQPETPKGAV